MNGCTSVSTGCRDRRQYSAQGLAVETEGSSAPTHSSVRMLVVCGFLSRGGQTAASHLTHLLIYCVPEVQRRSWAAVTDVILTAKTLMTPATTMHVCVCAFTRVHLYLFSVKGVLSVIGSLFLNISIWNPICKR